MGLRAGKNIGLYFWVPGALKMVFCFYSSTTFAFFSGDVVLSLHLTISNYVYTVTIERNHV